MLFVIHTNIIHNSIIYIPIYDRAGVGKIVFNWFIWFQEMARLKFVGQDSLVKFHVSIDVIVLNAMKTGNSGRNFVLQSGAEFLLLLET